MTTSRSPASCSSWTRASAGGPSAHRRRRAARRARATATPTIAGASASCTCRAAPGPFPVAVVLHGGSWRAGYDRRVMRPVCRDLVRRGWAAWNVEYRRVGGGQDGGWPVTFEDVAAGIDALSGADSRLDLGRVVLLGHSAGGHLALWAAGRPQLPDGAPGARPRVLPRAVIAPGAGREPRAGAGAGGARRRRQRAARRVARRSSRSGTRWPTPCGRSRSPSRRCSSTARRTARSRSARAATTRRPPASAGAAVELVEPPGATHRDHVDPRSTAWAAVTSRLDGLAALGNDLVCPGRGPLRRQARIEHRRPRRRHAALGGGRPHLRRGRRAPRRAATTS